jgi:hypothetical protein
MRPPERPYEVKVRLTQQEREELETLARNEGTSLAQVLRQGLAVISGRLGKRVAA